MATVCLILDALLFNLFDILLIFLNVTHRVIFIAQWRIQQTVDICTITTIISLFFLLFDGVGGDADPDSLLVGAAFGSCFSLLGILHTETAIATDFLCSGRQVAS